MIVAVSGKIGSGKDTVGDIIRYLTMGSNVRAEWLEMAGDEKSLILNLPSNIEEHSHWEIKKWADKLKDIICILIGCTREQLEDREFKEKELGEEWWYYIHEVPYKSGRKKIKIPFVSGRNLGVKIYKHSPRTLLQLLGTDCGRDMIHPNIWINSLMADYKENTVINAEYHENGGPIQTELPNWIITDTRFPNEAEAILRNNGIIIRVNRGNGNTGDHPSETALDDFNEWSYVVDNNGTIKDLTEKIRLILEKEKII